MKLTLSHNDKSWLSFDLKDLMWLILVVGVWATLDYRTKYTNNVSKWNEQLQEKVGQQNVQIAKLNEQIEFNKPKVAVGTAILAMRSAVDNALVNVKQCIIDWDPTDKNDISALRSRLDTYVQVMLLTRSLLINQLEAIGKADVK